MRYILWASAILLIGTYLSGPVHDVDLWWHIVAGRWIVANLTVPLVDYWNQFAMGKPWVAYSWSFEALVAWLELQFGDQGLYALKILLACSLTFSVAYTCSKISKDWTFGLLLGLLGTTACFSHFTLRPQSVIWLIFALLICQAEKIRKEGLNFKSRVVLLLLMSAWANMHLTQALGILSIFLWTQRNDRKGWLTSIEATLLGLIGTFITPYGGTEWLVFLSKSDHPATFQSISEFQPATILQYPTAFLLLTGVLFLSFLYKNPKKISYSQLSLVSILILGGLAVIKFLPFAILTLCFLIARLWDCENRSQKLGNLAEGLERLGQFLKRIPTEGFAFLLLVMAFLNVYHVWQDPVIRTATPVDAIDFIQNNNLPGPLLHDFGRGGYVAYRYTDSKGVISQPVCIDGRTNVNPKEIWEAAHKAFNGRAGWEEYFAMVQPESVLWRNGSPLVEILLQKKQWCRVFKTKDPLEGYSLFVSNNIFRKINSENPGKLESDNC